MEILGIAIFASVVLYLAVTRRGFRKVVIWVGVACLLCAIAGGLYLWHHNRAEANAERAAAKAKRAALAADDAIQNARIVRADASDRKLALPPGYVLAFGNATFNEYGGTSLFSCARDDILARVANGERVKVLHFGYEWGTDGNYGAKIQLANGLTGCILDGSYLNLDGEWHDYHGSGR